MMMFKTFNCFAQSSQLEALKRALHMAIAEGDKEHADALSARVAEEQRNILNEQRKAREIKAGVEQYDGGW
jgi:hypothetical protein